MSSASPAAQVLVALAVLTFMVVAGMKKHLFELRVPPVRHPRLRGWRRVLRH
jgi:hypothetical protein